MFWSKIIKLTYLTFKTYSLTKKNTRKKIKITFHWSNCDLKRQAVMTKVELLNQREKSKIYYITLGWSGDLCQNKECDARCTYHGQCKNGTCLCVRGWNGKHCTLEGCPSQCSGHGECK